MLIAFLAFLFYVLFFQEYIMSNPFSFEFPEAVHNIILKSPKYILASDNIKLAYYDFLPSQPKVIIIFYHGGGAWSNQIYQYMAEQLNKKYNIATYLFDIRGHGNSQGPRGDATTTEQVFHDISSAIDFVSSKYPKCPVFLGGHSSGAGLILNYNNWNKNPKINGYILLAPFLGPQSKTAYEHNDSSRRFIKHVRFIPLILHALSNGFLFAHTPVIFFNYPILEKEKDHYLLEYYTNTMAQATTPYDAKEIFTNLNNSYCLLIGELDEQFIPEKVISFTQFAKQIINDHSIFKIISQSSHLSIVIEAPCIIAQWIQKEISR